MTLLKENIYQLTVYPGDAVSTSRHVSRNECGSDAKRWSKHYSAPFSTKGNETETGLFEYKEQ